MHPYAFYYIIVVGHTLRYTVSKFGVNQTNGSQDAAIFVPPPPTL